MASRTFENPGCEFASISGLTLTATTGTANSIVGIRCGNLVRIMINVSNSSAVAEGSNVFRGTISGVSLSGIVQTSTYSGANIIVAQIDSNTVYIRQAKGSYTANTGLYFTFWTVAS